eukprot:5765738-Pleurochrysis_carterae.AAC.2
MDFRMTYVDRCGCTCACDAPPLCVSFQTFVERNESGEARDFRKSIGDHYNAREAACIIVLIWRRCYQSWPLQLKMATIQSLFGMVFSHQCASPNTEMQQLIRRFP